MAELFDYINSLNNKNYLYDEHDCKNYNQFMINKFYMYFPETVFVANELNSMKLTDKMHYDFLFHFLSKGKRFTKWYKEDKVPNLNVVMEYYNVNEEVGRAYLKILQQNEIETLNKRLQKGGRV